jgi:hypothetical protein
VQAPHQAAFAVIKFEFAIFHMGPSQTSLLLFRCSLTPASSPSTRFTTFPLGRGSCETSQLASLESLPHWCATRSAGSRGCRYVLGLGGMLWCVPPGLSLAWPGLRSAGWTLAKAQGLVLGPVLDVQR